MQSWSTKSIPAFSYRLFNCLKPSDFTAYPFPRWILLNRYFSFQWKSSTSFRGGHNIKLAGKLTGYEIDVYREAHEDDEDVDIEEFSDEIEGWIIDEFKRVGLDTAKSILALNADELVKRTDLEETTVKDVIEILKSEFE